MTQPKQARQRKGRDAPRTYAWPPLPPHEFEVISVTSATGQLAKPWLEGWAVKVTAQTAVDKYELLGQMIKEDSEQAAVDWLKSSRYRDRDKKANRGTIVHSALESYLAGKKIEQEVIEAQLKEKRVPLNLWKSASAMIAGLMEFLYDEEPEVYWSEKTVYSRTHGYAGTPDIVGRMRVGDSLKPVIVDVKTSKDIYNEVALQLCAYARADFVGLDDGTEAPLIPAPEKADPLSDPTSGHGANARAGLTPAIEHGVVVRPTAGGKYEKATFTLTDDLYRLFLALLTVANTKDVVETVRRPS